MAADERSTGVLLSQVRTSVYDCGVPAVTGTRAEASGRIRDAIVAATVRIVAREGVSAVTHRRVAAAAGVALSSTTWHFATKAEILIAALRWTAHREVARLVAIAERLDDDFDSGAWADELADWLIEQVSGERDVAVALYRLQFELLDRPEAQEVHEEWGHSLRALGERVLESSRTITPDLDTRLVVAALDGLRLSVLTAGEDDTTWLRPAVERQLRALLG
jgi:TetR/AcrR family transcriptional regulator, regulator of biofilm formation and stress response